jgi:uncharacterized membrane protein
MNRVRNFLSSLQSQLWLIPTAFSVAALILAFGLLQIRGVESDPWWLNSGDAAAARGLLANLLSGLITMTSLVVSVTFVTLTLAANQLGPRLISIFMADRQIQSVLGLFLGTTLYVLVVLRAIDGNAAPQSVPHLAVTMASLLTLVCLFALLFYVHKIARSIIADTVVERVAADLGHHARRLLRKDGEDGDLEAALSAPRSASVSLGQSGYVQSVDYDSLLACGETLDAVLEVTVRPGQFVLRRGDHVVIHSKQSIDPPSDEIRDAFVVGGERLPTQDIEYAIRQLVEIALRALSSGINDQFTASAVLDRLGASLEEMVVRSLEPRVLCDGKKRPRVVANRSDMEGIFSAAFDLIRQAGAAYPSVLIQMADVIKMLGPVLKGDSRDAASMHLRKLSETATAAPFTASDRAAVILRVGEAEKALAVSPSSVGGR